MTKNKKVYAKLLNDSTYIDYFNRLKHMCMNVFEWKNLPETVDERTLEMTLFEQGKILYFNDEYIGDICLPFTDAGTFDIYKNPSERFAIGYNGYTKHLKNDNSEIIWNNYLHIPTFQTIDLYAKRLALIERTIDININAQRTPIIILCSDTQRLTMKNVYSQYDGFEPFIFGDKSLDIDSMKVLNTNAPFTSDKLQIIKHQIWDECMTFIGIENSNTDKKERLVESEVGGNDGSIESNRFTQLATRQQAVNKINKLFGTQIEVTIRSNLNTQLNSNFCKHEINENDDEMVM